MTSFAEQRARGKAVEKNLAAWLMRKGWLILPTYDFSGLADDKAPKLLADDPRESLVLPDLLAWRNRMPRWIEVKLKSRADLHRKTGVLETGISLRLFRQYQAVETKTGVPVWLVFAHEKENEARCAPLARLVPMARIYDGPKMGRSGMAFFPWDKLQPLAKRARVAA